MIEILEKALQKMKEVITCKNTPQKYKDKATKDYIRLGKDLDIIYAAYARLHRQEARIAKKYEIE